MPYGSSAVVHRTEIISSSGWATERCRTIVSCHNGAYWCQRLILLLVKGFHPSAGSERPS